MHKTNIVYIFAHQLTETLMQAAELTQIQELINRGALFAINHSGGKDSQAMYNLLLKFVPADQIVVIHADLPGMDWPGTLAHIEKTVQHKVYTCKAVKTFAEMSKGRGYFPSPKYRQCTSDLKRGPLAKLLRQILKERGLKLVVNCEGLRAQESTDRAKKTILKLDKRNSIAGREWYTYYPIHHLEINEVWNLGGSSVEDLERRRGLYLVDKTAALAGFNFHYAYAAGMSRLSCMACIMMSNQDLRISARENPEAIADLAQVEKEMDQTFFMPTKSKGRQFITDLVVL